jgi:hypothetical protein
MPNEATTASRFRPPLARLNAVLRGGRGGSVSGVSCRESGADATLDARTCIFGGFCGERLPGPCAVPPWADPQPERSDPTLPAILLFVVTKILTPIVMVGDEADPGLSTYLCSFLFGA